MSDSQCEVFNPCFGHCQCGDMGCPDDTNPAPPGDHMKISDFEEHSKETFPGKACAAPIGFQKNHIHWTCHNTGISTGEIPNPYRFDPLLKNYIFSLNPYSPSTTELPPATECTSVSKYVFLVLLLFDNRSIFFAKRSYKSMRFTKSFETLTLFFCKVC